MERIIRDFDELTTNGIKMGIRYPPCSNNEKEIKSSIINMMHNNRLGLSHEYPIEHLVTFDRLFHGDQYEWGL